MLLPPPSDESLGTVSFPRDRESVANELAAVTEVSERAMYAMYDAMRGAQTGAKRTAAKRRCR